MPQGYGGRAACSHRTHDSGDDLVSLAHGLVVVHPHHHIPEPAQLEVATIVLGTLLGCRVPPLTVHLDDDTGSDQQVDAPHTRDPSLGSHAKTGVLQCEPNERLGAGTRPPIGEAHPLPPVDWHNCFEGSEFMGANNTVSQSAVEYGDGPLAG